MSEPVPDYFRTLADRFDRDVWDDPSGSARVRLAVTGGDDWDFLYERGKARLRRAQDGHEPHALVSADANTWKRVAQDLQYGMEAFRSGRLSVRQNLHLGVAFLAATSGDRSPGRLEFEAVETKVGRISTMQAGAGEPVVMIHGLGGTKASFLPTVAALAPYYRAIAIDLPGFGDSDKPLRAAYDSSFFAHWVIALLDELGIDRAHMIGNSMGGRAALELGLSHSDRVRKLALLTPSLAWKHKPGWVGFLRFVRPELGVLQPAPRPVVERLLRGALPGGQSGWTAAGIDEFLRAYLQPRGRAAFYAAARHIVLEEPTGEKGFWTRLQTLEPETLFVWGKQDQLVPIAFARHVREVLPSARHVELPCGHVPQLEAPARTHSAVLDFLAEPAKRRKAKAA